MLQTGGSDQWGNLTSGTDLIHRVEGVHVHAIGTPLITNSDGTKFGKSEGNAIWLDPAMCSPYRFYQFWLNTDDADVISRLKVFTFLSRARIEELEELVEREPFRREAQRVLAHEVTTLVHGADATAAVDRGIRGAVRSGRSGRARSPTPSRRRSGSCRTRRRRPMRRSPSSWSIPGSSRASARRRRAIAQGGVSIDNVRIDDETATIEDRVLPGGMAVLRRGKKTLAGVFVQ